MIYRKLICPICGEMLEVETDDRGGIPGGFLLPRHQPATLGHGNLCAAYRITITFNRATCDRCSREMTDHPTGLCMQCFSSQ